MKASVLFLLILGCLSVSFCAGTHPSSHNPKRASMNHARHSRFAPDVQLLDVRTGIHQNLHSFKGKLTVLYIAKTHCQDCAKIHAGLNRLTRQFPAQSVNFLALFLSDSVHSLRDMLHRFPLSYYAFILQKQDLPLFQIRQLPAHLVLNPQWEIIFRLEGSHTDPIAQLVPIIRRYINP